MSFVPKPHEIYRHFKGNLYQIVTIAEHSETGKQLVIYQALYGDFKTYARDLEMFISPVDKAKYPEAVQEFRFELQGPESGRQKAELAKPELAIGADTETEPAEPKAEEPKPAEPKAEEPKVQKQEADAGPEAKTGLQTADAAGKASSEAGRKPQQEGSAVQEAEECVLDPMLVEFLDADSYEAKLNVLAGLHHRITQDMITIMAVSNDIEVEDGELEDRYQQLKTCLLTREKYECKRI